MARKSMKRFIEENREELKAAILRACNGRNQYLEGSKKDADDEIRQWILNDEGLYNWARREGVDI